MIIPLHLGSSRLSEAIPLLHFIFRLMTRAQSVSLTFHKRNKELEGHRKLADVRPGTADVLKFLWGSFNIGDSEVTTYSIMTNSKVQSA